MNNDNIHRDIDAMIERYLANRQDTEAIEELKRKALENEESCNYIRKKLEGAFYVEANVSRVDFDKDEAYRRFRLRTASAAGREKKHTGLPYSKLCSMSSSAVRNTSTANWFSEL